jgi:hypothetical protein
MGPAMLALLSNLGFTISVLAAVAVIAFFAFVFRLISATYRDFDSLRHLYRRNGISLAIKL